MPSHSLVLTNKLLVFGKASWLLFDTKKVRGKYGINIIFLELQFVRKLGAPCPLQIRVPKCLSVFACLKVGCFVPEKTADLQVRVRASFYLSVQANTGAPTALQWSLLLPNPWF